MAKGRTDANGPHQGFWAVWVVQGHIEDRFMDSAVYIVVRLVAEITLITLISLI